jgi:hypothetical protein
VLTSRLISFDGKPLAKLMSLVLAILAIVSNDRGQALHPFLEDALDICESEVIPTLCVGLQNRLLALELSIPHVML